MFEASGFDCFQPSKPFGFMAQNKQEIICIEKYSGPLCRPYLDPELIPRWVLTYFDFGDPMLFITILLITRVSSVASYNLQQQTRSKCTLKKNVVGLVLGYFPIWIISRCPVYFCGFSFFEFSAIFGFVIHVFRFFLLVKTQSISWKGGRTVTL